MFKLHQLNTAKSKRYQELQFLTIESINEYDSEKAHAHDAIILNIKNALEAEESINLIRQQTSVSDYLKPIFISKESLNRQLRTRSYDGFTDAVNLQAIAQTTRKINERISKVYRTKTINDYKQQQLFKVLAFTFTRNIHLDPYTSRYSKLGYSYPFLDALIEEEHSQEILEIVELGLREELFSGKINDKIHLCTSCSSSYINIRETCPKCHSIDITEKDLIHHFRCAHIAPMEDFQKEDNLTCPKCDHKLRHIGIDYDKPSVMYNCNTCHHEFQEPEMKSYCIDCHKEDEIHHLVEKKIYEFSLTPKGDEVVKYGLEKLINSNEEIPKDVLSCSFFKLMLQQEIERATNHDITSFHLKMNINKNQVPQMTESTEVGFKKEIISIIKGYLLSSDLITAVSAYEYQILLTNTDIHKANELTGLITNNLNKLITDNLSEQNETIWSELKPIQQGLKMA